MTSSEEIEDLVEHLVDERGITCISELTRAEQFKLAKYVLRKNHMYMQVLHMMQKPITKYLFDTNRL